MTPFYIKIRKKTDALIKQNERDIRSYLLRQNISRREIIRIDLYSLIYNSYYDLWKYIVRVNQKDLLKFPSVDHFIYHADGIGLQERIDRWLDEYNRTRNLSLLYMRLRLITKHGHRYIDADMNLKIIKEDHRYNYVTIDVGLYGESCEDCRDHHGTYLINENFDLPPYHPDCDCVYWFHNEPRPEDEPDETEWTPESPDIPWKPEQEGV